MARSWVSAVVLVSRIASRDWRAWSGRSSSTSSATPACMATAANPCPATSWTSWATRIRSSSAALATRSCRARSAAVDRTWMSAPSDQGTTSQLVHPQQQDRRQVVRVSHQARQGEATATAATAHMPAATWHAMAPGDLEHRHHHAQLDGAVGVAGQQRDAHPPDRAAEPPWARARSQRARGGHHEQDGPDVSGRGSGWQVAALEPAMTTAAAGSRQTSIGGGTPGASLHRRGCILRAG